MDVFKKKNLIKGLLVTLGNSFTLIFMSLRLKNEKESESYKRLKPVFIRSKN